MIVDVCTDVYQQTAIDETTDYGHPERTYGHGQTFLAEIFCSVWEPLFLQKTKPKYVFGSGI